ncbi:MAG: hypothetical protein A2836_00960 [Candidatus Taylorbacteria bacterium RIFCSPHIGHO2_01_FULL_45_63]|uniref:Uncharacterized protein n=1 Tax=Candidatus Taylorbacteria bacterium RIFCSPHIGHO2_02_FULL_45_35 TaxID=1802311 RepID=A0A1G2MUW7_9BACT|nr:MAG: hypothetical protein A2836_00960 [Candidatus Taylorbacteria bacterium RIFCSPHIGHO2_01_FULL_45_63]OHA27655.1 MAG: hypothetical protein A3D56_04195 [Candidatus Taylorbacteria bacterium RIFCSPHIGHO2_02_FULL_45_35]
MVYPTSAIDRLKYHFWRLYTPCHPFLRDTLVKFRILWHRGRQGFLIGRVPETHTIQEFISFLVEQGYGNHFVAWKDEGEIAGLRYVKDFVYQYHIRVFEDGEVRGHYEYTPECYPILHFFEIDQEDRREEFFALLGSRIVPIKT